MQTETIYFVFNTAFCGVDENTGKLKQEEHDALAKILRGKIMQLDGIDGMFVERYEMNVRYVTGIVGQEQVVTWVQKCVAEFAVLNETSFPVRAKKSPLATPLVAGSPVATQRRTDDYIETVFRFNFDLVSSELSPDKWQEARSEVAAWLMHANGTRECEVFQREIKFKCDRREFTKGQMQERVRLVLEELRIRGTKTKYFPFLEADMSVIVREKG